MDTSDDNQIGYYVECDLHFPEHLHDKFKDFPPCPESLTPDESWLSDFQKDILKQNGAKAGTCNKLFPHRMDQEKYVLHYRNLKFISDLGVEVTKLHRVIQFEQKAWLKPYIDKNADLRTKAKNDFE